MNAACTLKMNLDRTPAARRCLPAGMVKSQDKRVPRMQQLPAGKLVPAMVRGDARPIAGTHDINHNPKETIPMHLDKIPTLVRTLLAGLAWTLTVSAGPALAAEDEFITVATWSRYSGAFYDLFTRETGIEVKLDDYNGGLAQVRAQVETGNITWDVVFTEAGDTLLGCDEGLLETVDYATLPAAPDGTPATEDFMAGYEMDCGVKFLLYSTVYAYNDAILTWRKPATMADFFDLETFPGRRGMRRAPNTNLEFALVADGVPADRIYAVLSTEAGIARAFRKLDTIKSQVVWWEVSPQPAQLLADGEVIMSTAFNGRIFKAWSLDKQPLAIVWDGQVLASGYFRPSLPARPNWNWPGSSWRLPPAPRPWPT